MRATALAVAITLASGITTEAATRVQSGDHIGFARLVVYFDRGQEWSLEKSDTGYRLDAPGLGDGFDTSRVFEMIQRDRIAEVSSTDDVLNIDLSCNCEATTSELSSGQLVIDFADASTTKNPDQPETDQSNAEPSADSVRAVEQPPQTDTPSLAQIDLPIVSSQPTLELPVSPDPETPVATTEELTEFRRRLLENLGRSATLSLVDLAESDPTEENKGNQPARHLSGGQEFPDRTRITNAIDNARSGGTSRQSIRRAVCPDPALFQIADWGSEDGFAAQISDIRRNILGEFDEVDTIQVRDLVRAYLHYGLTAEARHIVEQFDEAPKEKNILIALSHLIDGDQKSDASHLAPYDHCGGPIVPWRLLDMPQTATVSEEHKQTIAAEFTKWPKPLQESLGPRLMQILEQRGFDTTASFLNAILGDGRPAIDKEKVGVSAPLEDIKDGVEEGSPEALANFLRRAIDDELAIETRYVELASAFERETAGTDLSTELHNLRVEALAVQGDISELTRVMEKQLEDKEYPPEIVNVATAHVLNGSAPEDAAVFSAFLLRLRLTDALPDERIFQIADRLLEVGLPNLAKDVLSQRPGPELPTALDARLASSDRHTDRLVDLINSLPNLEERDLSANEVLNIAGVDQLRSEVVESLSQGTQDRVAWASSDWQNVQSDGPEGNISRLIVDLAQLELADEPLTKAKEIQGKAAETRALLDQVLQQTGE